MIGVSKREKRKTDINKILVEIIEDNFPKLNKHKKLEIQENLQTSGRIDNTHTIPMHIRLVKLLKSKNEEKTKSNQIFKFF